jgi:hypothetical protein
MPKINRLALNIGLARNDGQPDNSPEHAEQCLRDSLAAFGFGMLYEAPVEVRRSATEQTLVGYVIVVHDCEPQTDALRKAINACSIELAQDCIAVRIDGAGELIGPNAAAWGTFNPQYWLS